MKTTDRWVFKTFGVFSGASIELNLFSIGHINIFKKVKTNYKLSKINTMPKLFLHVRVYDEYQTIFRINMG